LFRPRNLMVLAFVSLYLSAVCAVMLGHERKREDFGLGLSTEIAAPENEVLQAVEAVASNGIIQGTQEYNKDKFVEHASAASSSPLFPAWKGAGTVFYKVRTQILAPVNFKEANDEGTLAVRYVVQAKDASKTFLRIDAVFAEDFRHTVHASDGSVENAEGKDIQDHVDALNLQKSQAQEFEAHRQQELATQALARKSADDEAATLAAAQTSVQSLERHVRDLRRQAERVIKAPGADLKAAPFHSASKLKSLEAGSEVIILITTSYWYGVETEDGQHGWIHHSQLETLP
jgi:hypothetical protein